MTTPITNPLTPIEVGGKTITLPQITGQAEKTQDSASFANVLGELVNSVNSLQQDAGRLEGAMYAGEVADLHQVMIAAEKAGIAFELVVEVRNKLVEAYQELMRMPM